MAARALMPARRSSARRWRGRSLIVFVLLAFVGTAVIVVWRRGRGVAEERLIADLDRQRRDLEAQRVLLERDLREATSAARIVPAAQRRLGLRIATDSQLVTLSHRASGWSSDSL